MLSINYIRDNRQKVIEASKNKGYKEVDIDKLIQLDDQRRELIQKIQKINEEKNLLAKKSVTQQTKQQGKQLKEELKQFEDRLNIKEKEFNALLYQIPNLASDDVPIGKDETENKVVRKWGEPKKLDFKPKDHLELGESLDIIDIEKAAKISGTRFGYLKNEAVLLEFALIQLALKILTKENFIPIVPPVLIKKEITEKLGYWQAGQHEQYYWVNEPEQREGFYLVGTAEHSLVPMHMDEIFEKNDLPKRYMGFSTSFRREAGSYGKDTRGIFRVHQFDKVEMVSFATEDTDEDELQYLLSLQEKLFQQLDLPYQVVQMCTGELGFPTWKKYDLEVWFPSQNKYRELTSVSTTTDFQARRLNIKYQNDNQKKYVHILNGTAFAIGRTIIAILENYQHRDGSVAIPKALQSFLGKSNLVWR